VKRRSATIASWALTSSSRRPWLEEGRIDEGRRTLAELLDRAGEDAPAASRAARPDDARVSRRGHGCGCYELDDEHAIAAASAYGP